MPETVNFTVDLEHVSAIGDGLWLGDYISIVNAPYFTGPDLVPVNLNVQVRRLQPATNGTFNVTGLMLQQVEQGDIDYTIDSNQENLNFSRQLPTHSGQSDRDCYCYRGCYWW